MASIERLSIMGVRSFDNTRAATISFQTPLTLIVGYNGSGKTTVIECLKYVTTGLFPPGVTGAAFVHDPDLAGEKEVMAQVKLRFHSAQGVEMVCTRNMQLTAKKTGRTFKALEGGIHMTHKGDKATVSSTVAELNSVMPQYLGVSRSIIDNVIFCHQDESLWPLGPANDLKKRFDEIFEAQKYTKAIENIKVLRKKQAENLIAHRKDEEYLKINKSKAEDVEKLSRKLHAEIKDLRERTKELSRQNSEALKNADAAFEKANRAGEIVGKLNGKRIEEQSKQESVESLRQTLDELEGTDASLQEMLEQYEQRMCEYQEDLQAQRDHYSALGRQVNEVRNRVSAKERECGSFEAQKESFDRQVETRKKLVKETAHRHEIRGFDLDVDDDQIQAFMDRIVKMARDQNAAFERARRETQESLQAAQKVLNQINEQKTTLNSRKDHARQLMASNERKIGTVYDKLGAINVDEGGKVALESHLQDTQSKLQSAKSAAEGSGWNESIKSAESDLRKLEDSKQKLEDEMMEGTRLAGDMAQLDFLQKELKDRQRRLETMSGAHGDRIGTVVGAVWEPVTVEAKFQRAVEQATSVVVEAQRQRDGTNREMEQLDFKLGTCRSDLKATTAAVKSAAAAISAVVDGGPAEFQSEIRDLENNRNVLKSDADSFAMMRQYFEQCKKDAQEQKVCRTCTRSFVKDKEIETLAKNVERQLNKFNFTEAKQELDEIEEQLAAARAVAPKFDTWERLNEKEIPSLEKEEMKLSQQRDALLAQLESHDSTVSERQAAKRDIDAVANTVASIAKYASEISGFERSIQELAAKQKAAGMSRGLEIIQEENTQVKDEERLVKIRLANVRSEKEKAEKTINLLELEVRDINGKLSTASFQLKEKKSLECQIEELKSVSEEQRRTVKQVDQELQGLAAQLSQAQAKFDDTARRGQDRDRELQAETSKLNSSLHQLKVADEEIQGYLDRGGPERLRRAKQEVQNLRNEVARSESEQQQIVRDVKALEDKLRNHSDTRRSIVDNLRFRRDNRALETVREEIEELESHDAESEKDQYTREGQKWQMQRAKLSAAQAEAVGECKSKDHQLEQLMEEYNVAYKDSARKYKEAHIKVETTKACIDDLGRYGGALDKAIMKYHSIKMEEINHIVDELWRKTYQGTDIDTIFIKSDNENVKGNKTYNYRVCMVKQDTEMDMRGRCSAGQKVLACIIIRLALAECFGVNCGLIALDEPTTNLDRDNIQALAGSLAEIIKVRKAQKNFQLIVITHDEDFLRYMNCSDYADIFWKVSRNDKQKSEIKKMQISQVM